MTSRHKPGATFWAIVVLVAVLVLYPLSGGAWVGCLAFREAPQYLSVVDLTRGFYAPIYRVAKPLRLTHTYGHYLFWCANSGHDLGSRLKRR